MVLITGATGFIGRAIVQSLVSKGQSVLACARVVPDLLPLEDSLLKWHNVGSVNKRTMWLSALSGVDTVIHCAARAHLLRDFERDDLMAYRSVNVDGTRRLAEQAAVSGVRRLVFISSIGVNGVCTNSIPRSFSSTCPDVKAFRPQDDPAPQEPYGISKWEAEQALWDVAAKTGLEVVVIRTPLVYGPGVKGNLARLLNLLHLGLPLPLGSVNNKRSLIGLDNLVDLLILCIAHPSAAGQTLLVSDGEDLSTVDLLRYMAAAMGRSLTLFPFPISVLRIAANLIGKQVEIDRLVGSLQIDSSYTRNLLGWAPPVGIQEGIRRMVCNYEFNPVLRLKP